MSTGFVVALAVLTVVTGYSLGPHNQPAQKPPRANKRRTTARKPPPEWKQQDDVSLRLVFTGVFFIICLALFQITMYAR